MTVTAARRFAASAERTLAVLGRVLLAQPYALRLTDLVGGHPLAGGSLVFALPEATGLSGVGACWPHLAYRHGAREVSAVLTRFGTSVCEVRLTANGQRGGRASRTAASELESVLRAVGKALLAETAFGPI
jgi:eukaryotic-like serine/threonine-protein kinase